MQVDEAKLAALRKALAEASTPAAEPVVPPEVDTSWEHRGDAFAAAFLAHAAAQQAELVGRYGLEDEPAS